MLSNAFGEVLFEEVLKLVSNDTLFEQGKKSRVISERAVVFYEIAWVDGMYKVVVNCE